MAGSHHRRYLAFQRHPQPLAEWSEVYEVLDHHVTNLKAAVGGEWSLHGPLHDADALTTALIRREGPPLQLSVSIAFQRGHGRRTFPKMPDPLPFEFCVSYLDPVAALRRDARARHLEQIVAFLDVWVIGGASVLMSWLQWNDSDGNIGRAALALALSMVAFIGVRVAVARWTQRLWLRFRRPQTTHAPPPAFLALVGPVERYLHDSRTAFMQVQRAKS